MKKIFATIMASVLMLAGTQAFAQVSLGAGYLNSSTRTKVSDKVTSLPLNGFYVGADYLITEGTGFGINVGAYYSYVTGTKTKSILGNLASGSANSTEMYLDLPVSFNYSVDLGGDLKGFVYAGPTFSLGLSSTVEASGSINIPILGPIGGSTEKMNLYDNSDLNRFDILVGGGVGVDYGSIRFKLGYDLGLLNRYNTDNMTMNRNILHVGVAYLF